jgi:hypothetical protein
MTDAHAKNGNGGGTWQAAKAAGLSRRGWLNAIRVARIPTDKFESMVESANPPTISQLANMGQRRQRAKEENQTAIDDEKVWVINRKIERFADEMAEVLQNLNDAERKEIRKELDAQIGALFIGTP